jgi:hypothetical protein
VIALKISTTGDMELVAIDKSNVACGIRAHVVPESSSPLELLPVFEQPQLHCYIDEEGRPWPGHIAGKPYNTQASILIGFEIYGDALVLRSDDDGGEDSIQELDLHALGLSHVRF